MIDSGNRRVTYVRYSTETNWQKCLPNNNWLLLLYEDNAKSTYFDEVISRAINNNVGYMCITGSRAEKIHDLFNEEIAYRMAENDFQQSTYHLPNNLIITTWHNDLEEGIDYAINLAEHGNIPIQEVICLDISEGDYFSKELKEKIK